MSLQDRDGPEKTVFSRFAGVAARFPEKPFLHVLPETAAAYGIEAGEITYVQMYAAATLRRSALAAANVGIGTRIGILLENRPVFLEIFLAANSLGASVVPINPDLRSAELEYLVSHSEMALAFVTAQRRDEVSAAAIAGGTPIPCVTPEECIPALSRVATANARLGPSTEAALLYTSGTTGRPKGCVLSNEYFLHSGDWYRDTGGLITLRQGEERMLTPLPVFHMNALSVSVMAMITVGGCLIILDRFHPRTWWQSVQASGATCLHYLGVMPAMLMSATASDEDRKHNVRFGFGAGSPRELHAPFEARFGFPLIEAWAMTETGSGGVICAHAEPRKVGTSCFGRPGPDLEVRIVDDAGNDAPTGVPGELLVRRAGPNPRYGFFSEYLKNPEATAEAWEGGWFHTGDIVQRDADGDLHFVDRKKNVIRRSGENIAAVEVETILMRHPAIREVGVTATPDPVRGDEVAALVVCDFVDDFEELVTAIMQWALAQMAYYKVPGWIGFVDALPRTPTEKILRADLKTLVVEKMARGELYDTRASKKRRV